MRRMLKHADLESEYLLRQFRALRLTHCLLPT